MLLNAAKDKALLASLGKRTCLHHKSLTTTSFLKVIYGPRKKALYSLWLPVNTKHCKLNRLSFAITHGRRVGNRDAVASDNIQWRPIFAHSLSLSLALSTVCALKLILYITINALRTPSVFLNGKKSSRRKDGRSWFIYRLGVWKWIYGYSWLWWV